MLDDESPTSTNLRNDHGFIIKEYSLHWFEDFREIKNKVTRAYTQSGKYHTIVESLYSRELDYEYLTRMNGSMVHFITK